MVLGLITCFFAYKNISNAKNQIVYADEVEYSISKDWQSYLPDHIDNTNIIYLGFKTLSTTPEGYTGVDIGVDGIELCYKEIDTNKYNVIFWSNGNILIAGSSCRDMFKNCASIQTLDLLNFGTKNTTNMIQMFYHCSNLTKINFSDTFNTKNVTTMFNLFNGCENLVEIDLSCFDTTSLQEATQMFYLCSSLESINFGENVTFENVTTISNMFNGCKNLKVLDLSKFATLKTTNMNSLFSGCEKLNNIVFGNEFKTQNVENMSSMFYNCKALSGTLDLTFFDMSKVTLTDNMFANCSQLIEIKFSKDLNTPNLINMSQMFYNCQSLTSLDFSMFDIQNVQEITNLFRACKSLNNINLDNLKTTKTTDISCMFYQCESLVSLDLSNFDTSNVTNTSRMFFDCKKLTTINVTSTFNLQNVTNMSSMFENCQLLNDLQDFNFVSQKIENVDSMFFNCKNIKSLDLSGFDFKNITTTTQMLYGMTSLKYFKTPICTEINNISINLPANNFYIKNNISIGKISKATNDLDIYGVNTLDSTELVKGFEITYKDEGNKEFSGTHDLNYPTIHLSNAETKLVAASKTDYKFLGWYLNQDTNEDSKVEMLTDENCNSNITIYAKWQKQKLTIIWKNSDGEF